jgi:hypothetical protein
MKVGDYVISNKPDSPPNLRVIVMVDLGTVFLSTRVDSIIMQACSPENLQLVTREDNPEYFI